MSTETLEIFGVIELAILLVGLLNLARLPWWKKEVAFFGCAFFIYGSGLNAVAFLVVTFMSYRSGAGALSR